MNTQDHSIKQDLPSIIQVIEEIYFWMGSERSRDGFFDEGEIYLQDHHQNVNK